jgi:hypothetical protein
MEHPVVLEGANACGHHLGAIGLASRRTGLIRVATGPAWELELSFVVGYIFGLLGWLLGIGVWERWSREWLG